LENNEEKLWYIYLHSKPCGEVFYVGIGKTKNFKRAKEKWGRNKHWKSIVDKYGYNVEIIFNNLTELEAGFMEHELVNFYGRKDLGEGNLCNKQDGGIIASNRSPEQIEKHRLHMTGLLAGEKHWNYGLKRPPETIEKISNELKGKYSGEKAYWYGKNHTPDSIQKMKDSRPDFNCGNSTSAKPLKNIETGEIYPCIKAGAEAFGLKRATLEGMLKGIVRNKTPLRYLEEENPPPKELKWRKVWNPETEEVWDTKAAAARAWGMNEVTLGQQLDGIYKSKTPLRYYPDK